MAYRQKIKITSAQEPDIPQFNFNILTDEQLMRFGMQCALNALEEFQKGQEEWLSIEALLERINHSVSAQTIRAACRKGQVKAKQVGGKWLVDANDYLRRKGKTN